MPGNPYLGWRATQLLTRDPRLTITEPRHELAFSFVAVDEVTSLPAWALRAPSFVAAITAPDAQEVNSSYVGELQVALGQRSSHGSVGVSVRMIVNQRRELNCRRQIRQDLEEVSPNG